jgi:hypothetical protein
MESDDSGKPCNIKEVTKKPKNKDGFGSGKQPPKNPGIIAEMANAVLSGETYDDFPERIYMAILMRICIIPSANMGLLGETRKLTVAADGTDIISHAESHGHHLKPDDIPENADDDFQNTHRRFADPDACFGWDSNHKQWFYGYTGYFFSVHNDKTKTDLPVFMRLVGANAFDGVTLIEAFAEARKLFNDYGLRINTVVADSAHDNLATYNLLIKSGVIPVIDLNSRTPEKKCNGAEPNSGNTLELPPPSQTDIYTSDAVQEVKASTPVRTYQDPGDPPSDFKTITYNSDGLPVCPCGYDMKYAGYDKTRYRVKFRCPSATGTVPACPFFYDCCDTPREYGKTVYVKTTDDPRLHPPIPRNTELWNNIYNERTAAERVNTKILTDYRLEQPKRYGKAKLCFFMFCNAINIHLDAQIKCQIADAYDSTGKEAT